MDHVAILDDVFLAFLTPLAGFLCPGLAPARDEVFVTDDLGLDEAALEIGMDHAGGLRGGGSLSHGPGTDFLLARGEIGVQPEQLVAGAHYAVQAGLFQAEFGEEFVAVPGVEFDDLRLDLVADRDHR